jgi:hypothetical protein
VGVSPYIFLVPVVFPPLLFLQPLCSPLMRGQGGAGRVDGAVAAAATGCARAPFRGIVFMKRNHPASSNKAL